MAYRATFGGILRDARERSHMTVSAAAAKLRVRPDIIKAIEECDFEKIPPKGYAQNMIGSYARLVGLDAHKVIQIYLDDLYSQQISTAQSRRSADARNTRPTPSNHRPKSSDNGMRMVGGHRESYRSLPGRERLSIYDVRENDLRLGAQSSEGSERYGSSRSAYHNRTPRKTSQSTLMQGKYGNMVQEPIRNSTGPSRKVIIGAIAAVVVIIALVVVFWPKPSASGGSTAEETANGAVISGLTDPEKSGVKTQNTTAVKIQPVAPSAAVVTYEVANGESAYIEIYIDDVVDTAETIDGPAHDTYDITGTLQFVTTNPYAVTLTVGGSEVTLEDDDGDGVCVYDLDFDEYLENWKAENITE